jgi:hypothetical protein
MRVVGLVRVRRHGVGQCGEYGTTAQISGDDCCIRRPSLTTDEVNGDLPWPKRRTGNHRAESIEDVNFRALDDRLWQLCRLITDNVPTQRVRQIKFVRNNSLSFYRAKTPRP